MKRIAIASVVAAATFLTATATSLAGHGLTLLDHPAPSFSTGVPDPAFQAGGNGATWELLATFPTGNPHTDLDFFTRNGDTYASVGTLGVGPNGAGQNILRLTERGEVRPSYVAGPPVGRVPEQPELGARPPARRRGLAEGRAASSNAGTSTRTRVSAEDAQILVDASDADGRCHDDGTLGLPACGRPRAPQGGLEIIDITRPDTPGRDRAHEPHRRGAHGQRRPQAAAHRVRGHVRLGRRRLHRQAAERDRRAAATASTSTGSRSSTCPRACTSPPTRPSQRAARPLPAGGLPLPLPERQRRPSDTRSRTTIYACHELEIYAERPAHLRERRGGDPCSTCRGRSTPAGRAPRSDDQPARHAAPVPAARELLRAAVPHGCDGDRLRERRALTGEPVALDVPGWLAIGAPVAARSAVPRQHPPPGPRRRWRGDARVRLHAGHRLQPRAGAERLGPPPDRHRRARRRRPAARRDLRHAGRQQDRERRRPLLQGRELHTGPPRTAAEEHQAYARTPSGQKAIYRAPVRTRPAGVALHGARVPADPGPEPDLHGLVLAGHPGGRLRREPRTGRWPPREAGWFLPANANTWVSHVFKYQKNANGTYTYWGATGDFNLAESGRSAIDVWKVTSAGAAASRPARAKPT